MGEIDGPTTCKVDFVDIVLPSLFNVWIEDQTYHTLAMREGHVLCPRGKSGPDSQLIVIALRWSGLG